MKRIILVFVLIFLALLGYHYFGKSPTPGAPIVQIYFPDKNNLFLVPISRTVAAPGPQTLLDELKKGPNDSEHLLPAFSAKESPVEITPHGKMLTVNFSEAPSLDRWPLVIQAFMATFKQLSDYDSIEFSVHGEEAMILDGEEIGKEPFSSFRINENLEASAPECPDTGCPRIIVYRQLNGTDYLVPITQNVTDKIPFEQALSEALKTKPKLSWALSSALSAGSKIISMIRPNAQEVNLILDLQGTDSEKARALKAILLTYSDIPGVRLVRYKEPGSLFPKKFIKEPFGLTINSEVRE